MVTSLGKWFAELGTNIGKFFSDLGESIGGFFSDLWKNIITFFQGLVDNVKGIFDWIGNFFKSLWEFFVRLVIPSDEQWSEIQQDYSSMGETVQRHIPFVGLFSEELKKAQEIVEKTDFLVITLPEFSYSGGSISVNTNSQRVVNIAEKYEPYRAYVRGGLFMIVVGLGFVYVIKYILHFGQTHAGGKVSTGDKGGDSE